MAANGAIRRCLVGRSSRSAAHSRVVFPGCRMSKLTVQGLLSLYPVGAGTRPAQRVAVYVAGSQHNRERGRCQGFRRNDSLRLNSYRSKPAQRALT